MRILLVDDDETLMESLAERLIQQRYAVDIAVDGSSAETYVDLFDYDLIVLDLMLPDGDGIEFCRTFRAEGYVNPLMILTAKESTAQKVKALDAGADDYVVKPFDFDELCARIRALLRRENNGLPTVLVLGPLRLDPSACETTYRNNPVRLTPKEFSMMELFLRHPHRVYSLGAIIDDLWSFEDPPGEDAVRTHIKGLRRKLKAAGAPKDLIKTVYGLGYRLNENTAGEKVAQAATARSVEDGKGQPSSGNNAPISTQNKTSSNNQAEKQSALSTQDLKQPVKHSVNSPVVPAGADSLSERSRPAIDAAAHQTDLSEQLTKACRRYLRSASLHVSTLEKVAAALFRIQAKSADSRLTADDSLFDGGRVCAHKLAGSLGSFGIAEGSQVARKIEIYLEEVILQASPFVPNHAADGIATAAEIIAPSETTSAGPDAPDQANLETDRIAQFSQWVAVLRSRIDQATVQAATEALAASMQAGLPVALLVSQADTLTQSLSRCAMQVNLRTQVVANAQQAIAVLELTPCDLVLIDMSATVTDELLAFCQSIKQRYALPIVVLSPQLSLAQRLILTQQGIEIVTHRHAPPLQIMTAAAGVIRAQVSEIRVAIADDDPNLLSLLTKTLTPWGFQVTAFTRAIDLWEWLASEPAGAPSSAAPPRVDILVLDIEMPEISGLDLCQILRADARFQSIPILFLTQHQDESLRIQAYQLGADDFIHKAVAPIELATRLRNQLNRACLAKPTAHFSA